MFTTILQYWILIQITESLNMGYPAVSSHLLYCLSYYRSYSLSVIVLIAFNFIYFLLFAYACVSLHFFLLCMFWMSCNRIANRLFPYHLRFQSVRLPFSGYCAEWTLTGFPNDCRTSHHFSASIMDHSFTMSLIS